MGRSHKSPITPGPCGVCGVLPSKHPRCNACGILIGKGISADFKGHMEQSLFKYKGLKLCGACYKVREELEEHKMLKRFFSDFWEVERERQDKGHSGVGVPAEERG